MCVFTSKIIFTGVACFITWTISYNSEISILKGIVEKAKETSSDSGMHDRAITVLHEQWMCHGVQRHTHITLYNLVIPTSVPIYSPFPQASNQLNSDCPKQEKSTIYIIICITYKNERWKGITDTGMKL